jgi:hypothetical protein
MGIHSFREVNQNLHKPSYNFHLKVSYQPDPNMLNSLKQ